MTAPEVQALARIATPDYQRALLRQKQVGLRVEFERGQLSVQDVADMHGVDAAIDISRHYGIHPDEWAEDLADDYDYEIHSLYDEYFYPAAGSGAW